MNCTNCDGRMTANPTATLYPHDLVCEDCGLIIDSAQEVIDLMLRQTLPLHGPHCSLLLADSCSPTKMVGVRAIARLVLVRLERDGDGVLRPWDVMREDATIARPVDGTACETAEHMRLALVTMRTMIEELDADLAAQACPADVVCVAGAK